MYTIEEMERQARFAWGKMTGYGDYKGTDAAIIADNMRRETEAYERHGGAIRLAREAMAAALYDDALTEGHQRRWAKHAPFLMAVPPIVREHALTECRGYIEHVH